MLNTKILGTGKYLPERIVTSEELDLKYGYKPGTFQKKSGVVSRHYASDEECSSEMGAKAAFAALESAGLQFEDIDLILGACGTPEQALPCTSALIQRAMGFASSGTPCFDVNATCLSFVTGMQVASSMIANGTYSKILIVSSEIASCGINYDNIEAASLFGDGAVAAVVGKSEASHPSGLLAYHMETYSELAETCEIAAGGSRLHPRRLGWDIMKDDPRFLFQMDGPKVFKAASKYLPQFVSTLCEKAGVGLDDIRLLIPHQASDSALNLVRRRLRMDEARFFKYNENHGNMIAASIPLGLHLALTENKVKSGDLVMLVGTSAGLSIGGTILRV